MSDLFWLSDAQMAQIMIRWNCGSYSIRSKPPVNFSGMFLYFSLKGVKAVQLAFDKVATKLNKSNAICVGRKARNLATSLTGPETSDYRRSGQASAIAQ